MLTDTLFGPEEVASFVQKPNILAQVITTFNKALSTPSTYEWSDPENGVYYRIHCAATLSFGQARLLLRLCHEAGWKNVKLVYTPGAVLVLLSMDGDRDWDSLYDDEHFKYEPPVTTPELDGDQLQGHQEQANAAG